MGDYDFKPGGGLKFKGGGSSKKCVPSAACSCFAAVTNVRLVSQQKEEVIYE